MKTMRSVGGNSAIAASITRFNSPSRTISSGLADQSTKYLGLKSPMSSANASSTETVSGPAASRRRRIRQALEAMRYSQVESRDRPLKRGRAFKALRNVSCNVSSASEALPHMRKATL